MHHIDSLKAQNAKPKKSKTWYEETLNPNRFVKKFHPMISPASKNKMRNVDYVPPHKQFYPKFNKEEESKKK